MKSPASCEALTLPREGPAQEMESLLLSCASIHPRENLPVGKPAG